MYSTQLLLLLLSLCVCVDSVLVLYFNVQTIENRPSPNAQLYYTQTAIQYTAANR